MASTSTTPGLRARYRAWYRTLPVGAQLIGLQLWLPTLFVALFDFSYVYAFHSLVFHDVPVVVVGAPADVGALVSDLDASASTSIVSGLDAATDEVRNGTLAAAYAPAGSGDGSAILVLASANGYQTATFATAFFQRFASNNGATVAIRDVAARDGTVECRSRNQDRRWASRPCHLSGGMQGGRGTIRNQRCCSSCLRPRSRADLFPDPAFTPHIEANPKRLQSVLHH